MEGILPPIYIALIHYKRKEFQECADQCTKILDKNPFDEAIWSLKTRTLTAMVKADDVEAEEDGIVDLVLDDNALRQVPRPGTSLRAAGPATGESSTGVSQAFRPTTQAGRPMSGVSRPGSSAGRPGTMSAMLSTPRTARTARPVSSASGRFVRLGTASMLSQQDGPFINLARLNIGKYASRPSVAKALFEYILYHENSVRVAMDLASQALQSCKFDDWYWKVALGKCYMRLGMLRDAERMLKSALKSQEMIDTLLLLARVYIRLDQPMAALEVYRVGSERFPGDTSLLTGTARIYEAIGNFALSAKYYRIVLKEEPINIEAIACVGMNHFYADQPEVSLRFYRRLLQMGVNTAELYNNLGLCCFYSQQYDMSLTCLDRALSLSADPDTTADIWYNLGHVALAIGDTNLAFQCFRLALASNSSHAEAFNDLGILEMRRGSADSSKAHFQSSASIGSHLYEPSFNLALLAFKTGDLQTSYLSVHRALKLFPGHHDSKVLLERLNKHFVAQ